MEVGLMTKKYLSPKEASEVLGVSTSLLQKWRTLKVKLNYVKLGESTSSIIRYKLDDLLHYLEQNIIKTM
jgi:hypothetical protein